MRASGALVAGVAILWLGCSVQEPDERLALATSNLSDGPTAVLTGGPTSGPAPLYVYLDGTTSKPASDGSWIASCGMDFGDGASTTNCWGTHAYAAGAWTAVFTVTDNLGRSSSVALAITAGGGATDGGATDGGTPDGGADDGGTTDGGTPDGGTTDGGTTDGGTATGPTAVLSGGPTSGFAPLNVSLDGTRSRPAGDGSWIATCLLEFGDGASTNACWGSHTYEAGTWTARFTVTDNLGRTGVATLTITARGTTPTDGGTTTDGGTPPPNNDGWQFFGAAQGGPREVLGVSSDRGGNIWVAGGNDGLYLLTPGATEFRRFTLADGLTGYNDGTGLKPQRVISVAGGPEGTVFVGYQGLSGCQDAFERYNFRPDGSFVYDPAHEYIWKSGDADRVTLSDSGISVVHYDISSPPGTVAVEPQGREKICSVLRIAYHWATQSAWFGGNHGVAWGNAQTNAVVEHTHPAVNGYVAYRAPDGTLRYSYTLLTDAYGGLAVQPNGDLWLGGANRSANFRWASLGRSFWNADAEIQRTKLDLWPDAVANDSYPSQRVDDNVSDAVLMFDGTLWFGSISNGLAHITSSGTEYLRLTAVEPNSKVTSLEQDPLDGSLWVGFIYGGLSRLKDGQIINYDWRVFGSSLVQGRVPDIQSDVVGGQRRILVAFQGQSGVPAGIYIYTGD